jgi:hypothetical protein
MDITSPLNGLPGPALPLWTADIEAVTAAFSAPPGLSRPARRVRRVLAGLAVVTAVAATATALPAGSAATNAAASPGTASTAHATGTWT